MQVEGTSKSDPEGIIALDVYRLTLSADGLSLSGSTRTNSRGWAVSRLVARRASVNSISRTFALPGKAMLSLPIIAAPIRCDLDEGDEAVTACKRLCRMTRPRPHRRTAARAQPRKAESETAPIRRPKNHRAATPRRVRSGDLQWARCNVTCSVSRRRPGLGGATLAAEVLARPRPWREPSPKADSFSPGPLSRLYFDRSN